MVSGAHQMIKHCIICGAEFSAPPSSKKITCSPECSGKRKTLSHNGNHNTWSIKARAIHSERMKAKGLTDSAKKALSAAYSRPDSKRGPQHRNAKVWVLIDPDGAHHTVVNLLDWARQHAHLFDVVDTAEDRERVSRNIRSGFEHISQTILGHREHPVYSYKGWGLASNPKSKAKDDDND